MIETGENLGFARANNVGIRATTSDLVLLLNPDTVVPDGAIQRLAQTLERSPDAACVGPRLVDAAGRPELSFGWTISPIGELRQKLVGALYDRNVSAAANWVERQTRAVRRTRVDQRRMPARTPQQISTRSGLFDERYFMYTEDVDLCASFRARGCAVLFDAGVTVTHRRGQSAATNPQHRRLTAAEPDRLLRETPSRVGAAAEGVSEGNRQAVIGITRRRRSTDYTDYTDHLDLGEMPGDLNSDAHSKVS